MAAARWALTSAPALPANRNTTLVDPSQGTCFGAAVTCAKLHEATTAEYAAGVASEVRVVRVDRRDAQAQHCHKEMVFWLHRTTTRDRSTGTLAGGRTPAAAHACTTWKRRSPMAPCRAAAVDQGGRCSAGGGSLRLAALCAPDLPPSLPPPLPPPPVGLLWREQVRRCTQAQGA